MKLSVHIVTDGRTDLFRRCCESVARALPPGAEVCVVINGEHPDAVRFLEEWNPPHFRWVTIPRCTISGARNHAFQFCRGKIIHFLDDDVTVGPDLFTDVVEMFETDPGLSVVGGPNLTPPGSSALERAFGAVMANPFAAPLVNRRYQANGQTIRANETHLIFCNLAVRPEHLPPTLRFCEGLKANEENFFLYQSRRLHLQALWSPKIWVYHRRRATVYGFFKQVRHYGSGRGQQTWREPTSSSALFLLPPAAVVGGFALLVLAPRILAILVLVHSCLAWVAAGRMASVDRNGTPLWIFAPLSLLVHFAYGWGFWLGWVREAKAGLRMWLHQKLKPAKVGASVKSMGGASGSWRAVSNAGL